MNFQKKILRYGLMLFTISLPVLFSILILSPKSLETKIKESTYKIQEVTETVIPQPTVIKENGIPNRFLIQAPFVPQAPEKDWSQPWQDACEEAALLIVDYYYKKINPDIAQMRNDILALVGFETSKGWGHDINLSQASIVSTDYFKYQPQVIENPTIESIQKYISQNIPVIVPAHGKTLYKENKYFSNGGPEYHMVVVVGYDDKTKQFIVHDVGTQFGKNFRYSYDLFMESIHDFPESGNKKDVKNGAKKILVLLK